MGPILLLGAGNILLQDEGLGVHALRRLLERYILPSEVLAVDGGVQGMDLLPLLEEAQALLIVDAVAAGAEPGALVRLEGRQIPSALALKISMHQMGLQELLALGTLRGTLPTRVVLWGMEPASMDWGLALSEPVAYALDGLVESVAEELRAWGAQPQPIYP